MRLSPTCLFSGRGGYTDAAVRVMFVFDSAKASNWSPMLSSDLMDDVSQIVVDAVPALPAVCREP